MANKRSRTLQGENRWSAALSQSNLVAIREYPISNGFSKNSQTWDLAERCVMAELQKDNSQSYNNIII